VTVSAPTPPGPAPVASIVVRPKHLQLLTSRSAQLQTLIRDSAGRTLEDRPVQWSSSNSSVASVSKSGMVTGMAPGGAVIIAISEAASPESVLVSVEAPPVVGWGYLRMIVSPWAYVLVDGRGRGQRSRGADSLSAAVPHRLQFERNGFTNVDTTVILQSREMRSPTDSTA